VPAKYALIAGSAGEIVAPAMTVNVLANSRDQVNARGGAAKLGRVPDSVIPRTLELQHNLKSNDEGGPSVSTTIDARPLLTVGELAQDSGVAPSAVRFYEQHGLITATRTAGNQRRFTTFDGCRIKVIRVAQRVGISVQEIKALLDLLPAGTEPSSEEWAALQQALVHETNKRVAELNAVLADLGSDTKLCELSPAI
jgi:MerR family redox-sensitive transcriptional activator SoxR